MSFSRIETHFPLAWASNSKEALFNVNKGPSALVFIIFMDEEVREVVEKFLLLRGALLTCYRVTVLSLSYIIAKNPLLIVVSRI